MVRVSVMEDFIKGEQIKSWNSLIQIISKTYKDRPTLTYLTHFARNKSYNNIERYRIKSERVGE